MRGSYGSVGSADCASERVRRSRRSDILVPDYFGVNPEVPVRVVSTPILIGGYGHRRIGRDDEISRPNRSRELRSATPASIVSTYTRQKT